MRNLNPMMIKSFQNLTHSSGKKQMYSCLIPQCFSIIGRMNSTFLEKLYMKWLYRYIHSLLIRNGQGFVSSFVTLKTISSFLVS